MKPDPRTRPAVVWIALALYVLVPIATCWTLIALVQKVAQ